MKTTMIYILSAMPIVLQAQRLSENYARVCRPAQYDTIREVRFIKSESKKAVSEPSSNFETVIEIVMVKPEERRLMPVRQMGCNVNPTVVGLVFVPTRYVMETIPAQYDTIIRKVPKFVESLRLDPNYEAVQRLVLRPDAVNHSTSESVTVYPTLVTNEVQISGAKSVQLFNANGQIFYNGSDKTIPMGHLTSGAYFLRGEDLNGAFFTVKLVKM